MGARPPWARWVTVLGIAAVILVADQLSKAWALEELSSGRTIDLIGSLRFNLAFNTGMAFSQGAGAGPIIGCVALGIVVVLLFVARRVTSTAQLALIGVVIGGALGNVVDRLTRVGDVNPFTGEVAEGFMSGAVVDFIDLQWWPVFNIADAAVVVGGLVLALMVSFAPDPSRRDGDGEGGTGGRGDAAGPTDAATGPQGTDSGPERPEAP